MGNIKNVLHWIKSHFQTILMSQIMVVGLPFKMRFSVSSENIHLLAMNMKQPVHFTSTHIFLPSENQTRKNEGEKHLFHWRGTLIT